MKPRPVYTSDLPQCFYSDEHCDCKEVAVICDYLSPEPSLTCLRHFGKIKEQS